VRAAAQDLRLQLRPGSFVGPVLRRVVGIVAARSEMSVDRVDEVILLAEAMGQAAARHVADERLGVSVRDGDGSLRLEFGPLEPGIEAQSLTPDDIPANGDHAEVRRGDGGEYLVLTMAVGH
jgi:hypothetical protein